MNNISIRVKTADNKKYTLVISVPVKDRTVTFKTRPVVLLNGSIPSMERLLSILEDETAFWNEKIREFDHHERYTEDDVDAVYAIEEVRSNLYDVFCAVYEKVTGRQYWEPYSTDDEFDHPWEDDSYDGGCMFQPSYR